MLNLEIGILLNYSEHFNPFQAIGYERDSGSFSRVHQMAKNMLTGVSSGMYNCPLAMTDGAAMIAEAQKSNHPELKEAYDHLTSRDPKMFWTSGQWMTEKAGGSDVGKDSKISILGKCAHVFFFSNYFYRRYA